MKIILSLFFVFSSILSIAEVYTRHDSLRGFLYPEKSCYDVHHYKLAVDFNLDNKSINGSVTFKFTAVENSQRFMFGLKENLTIDYIALDDENVTKLIKREMDAVFVHSTLVKGRNYEMVVEYSGVPQAAKRAPWDGGFDWAKDKKGNHLVGVACEGDGALVWWPNKDHLSDEPDSMDIQLIVPKGYHAISNGRLQKRLDIGADKTLFHWAVKNPINAYNATFYIGKYVHFDDIYINGSDTLTLDYFVLPYNLKKAEEQFKETKDILTCFEKFFGKYPFYKDGFKLVESHYLGMEHQSAIAYGNQYKFGYLGRNPLKLPFDFIILHESGHEWFGNNISMKDRNDMWIHESFTTYTETVYMEWKYGYDTAMAYLKTQEDYILNLHPIHYKYGVNFGGWKNDSDLYYKGARMLHTMRSVVNNDEKWWAALKKMNAVFFHKTVDYDDIVNFMCSELGENLRKIFDQYLHYADLPTLQLTGQQKGRNMIITAKWDSEVEGFDMPISLQFESQEVFIDMTGGEGQVKFRTDSLDKVELPNMKYYIKLARKN